MANSSKTATDMNQLSQSRESKYVITRKAPPPPKTNRNTAPEFKCSKDTSSDFVNIRYTNIESALSHKNWEQRSSGNIRECLLSIVDKLIEKEQMYVLTLKSLMKQLDDVSTIACNKLPLLQNILDFHNKILLRYLYGTSEPLEIPCFFLKFQDQLDMYVIFTESRKDFSYLVTDLCKIIIDHLKARLLEYNFTISQIKNVCLNNIDIRVSCNEAEAVIKEVYQRIITASKVLETEEQREQASI